MKFVNAAKAIAFSSIIKMTSSTSALNYGDTKKNRVDDIMLHQAPSYQDSANQRTMYAHLHHDSLVLSKKKLTLSYAVRSLSMSALPTYSWSQLGDTIHGKGNAYDWFGYSTSTSEDGLTVAVGAVYDASHPNGNYGGYVQVLAFDTGSDSWNQLGQTIHSDSLAHDYSGWSISLSANGKVLAISSPNNSVQGENSGQVRIFRFNTNRNKWKQMGDSIYGENAGDHSGMSVSLSANGKVVVVGAPDSTGMNGAYSGHARVYTFLNQNWTQVGQDIDGEDIADWSGVSVSLSSDGLTVAVGAKGNDANGINAGHVRVYTLDQNETWNKLGQDLDGEAKSDYFGYSVSLSADGRIVATGAPYNDGTGTSAGHVRVYRFSSAGVNAGSWIQVGNDIDGEEAYDESGWSVSLASDGLTVAVGSPKNNYGNSAGYTRVFRLDESTNIWKQMGANICGLAEYDYSGWSVSLSGDGETVVVGDTEHDANGVVDSGQVRVFKLKEIPFFCGTDAAKFEGHAIYFSAIDPIVQTRACFKVDASEGGIFAADSSDPNCKNTENFNPTQVYSTFKRSKFSKFIMKSTNDDLGYNGVIFFREKANLVVKNGNAVGRIIQWDDVTKSFRIRLNLPLCEI